MGKLQSRPWTVAILSQRSLIIRLPRFGGIVLLFPHAHLDWEIMHRASTRYTKRSSSTKAKQGPGQYPEGLQVGEGGDLRRKILQRTHSIASRSTSNPTSTTTPSGTTTKSTPHGLESYYMSTFGSPHRRSPRRSLPPSPSQGHFPSPKPMSSSAFENHYRLSFDVSPKQVSSPPNPPSKEREDVDITDYYSESIRMRSLHATPFSDLPNSPPSSPSSPCTCKREETNSVEDLDFVLQILLARQRFGTNGVPGIQRGQDQNAWNPPFGSTATRSHVHPSDGDIGEGLPIGSDSDRRRGVSLNMSVWEGGAGTNDNASVDGFDISSRLSTNGAQRRPTDAVKLRENVTEEPSFSSPAEGGEIIDSSKLTSDLPYEADICDVELTSLSPRAGGESTFTNFTPPRVFDAFLPILPPTCRIKTVSQLPTSVF